METQKAAVTPAAAWSPTPEQQQVFSLSWLANYAGIFQWSRALLQQKVDDFKARIGAWEVVWGPCYFVPPGAKPVANAMYVARAAAATRSTYVIAVAGTNPQSLFDLAFEDLDIASTPWPHAANAGHVAQGDLAGLANLLNLQDGALPLARFLANLPNPADTSLIFSGHSLGGALAPFLALALMDPASLQSQGIHLDRWGSVSVLATAGPSVGDAAFLRYFRSVMARATISFIWNLIDVVPRAWNAQSMEQIATLYGPKATPMQILCIGKVIKHFQVAAGQHDYVLFEPAPAFTGELLPVNQLLLPASKFVAQAGHQHTTAYVSAFACDWLKSLGLPNWNNPDDARKRLDKIVLAAIGARICLAIDPP